MIQIFAPRLLQSLKTKHFHDLHKDTGTDSNREGQSLPSDSAFGKQSLVVYWYDPQSTYSQPLMHVLFDKVILTLFSWQMRFQGVCMWCFSA